MHNACGYAYSPAQMPEHFADHTQLGSLRRIMSENPAPFPSYRASQPALHFVGFRDERYWNAVRIWGRPDFIHITYDRYAAQDMAPWDIVVFAKGDWTQEPRSFSGPDLIED